MTVDSIYRQASLKAKQTQWLGNIILIRPISFTVFTAFSVALATVVIAFFIWGTYTKHTAISGQLVPNTGLVKVYVPQPGIVMEKHVVEGQFVERGDVLYVLSSERQSSTQGNTQAAISSQVATRQKSLQEELEKTRHVQKDERQALAKKVDGLQAELLKLDSQIEDQKIRVKLAEDTIFRYQDLVLQGYISKAQLQQKQEDQLDQRTRLQSLERDRISIGRELVVQKNELSSLAFKQQNLLAHIERSISSTVQELSESEAKRNLVITASETGIATAIAAEIGQAVDASIPLVSIMPRGAILQAHLYARSKAIGFVNVGDAVLLRYQAYPYQKFGHARGTVTSVARTALPSNELTGMRNLSGSGVVGNNEPLYQITVNLSTQTINVYGKHQSLQAGMLLEADVLQDTRRLYEWVLEPLYSLTDKLSQ